MGRDLLLVESYWRQYFSERKVKVRELIEQRISVNKVVVIPVHFPFFCFAVSLLYRRCSVGDLRALKIRLFLPSFLPSILPPFLPLSLWSVLLRCVCVCVCECVCVSVLFEPYLLINLLLRHLKIEKEPHKSPPLRILKNIKQC